MKFTKFSVFTINILSGIFKCFSVIKELRIIFNSFVSDTNGFISNLLYTAVSSRCDILRESNNSFEMIANPIFLSACITLNGLFIKPHFIS